MNRRETIRKLFSGTVLGIGGGLLAISCGSEKSSSYDLAGVTSCDDLEGLPEEEINKRKQLGYVEETPIDDNTCDNCQLYLPPTPERKCGGCQLFKGPVKEKAYCTYWAPRIEGV
ncbi:high-potential iron-sulfur protein [Lunatibacter salilacus]|uniref:high-potential iron-sulfur protein n=1 Tax=Lunatibacter salilacus TaxID=2483804 RepID=UPI00131DF562|nr:high-potential iron-sulfur protein [Lunatibacter salilacus]